MHVHQLHDEWKRAHAPGLADDLATACEFKLNSGLATSSILEGSNVADEQRLAITCG